MKSTFNRPLLVIMATAALDAAGFSLIAPILPSLLRNLAHTGDVATHYGVLLAAYALMQFLFSPLLGLLSDRVGRRPVLLASLGGAALDYLVMAFAPTLWLLYVSRIVSGVTGANMAVAGAYIADVTPEQGRARAFGRLSAAFGIGFMLGPLLGGWLGQMDVRWPFLAAAALNGVNFLLGWVVLPESRKPSGGRIDWRAANPFAALRGAFRLEGLGVLLAVFGVIAAIGQIGSTLWVIYGQDRFAWTPAMVGVSLTAFGLLHGGAQALVTGPAIERLGERAVLVFALFVDALAYALMGVVGHGWMAFALIPLMALGSLEGPAVQALLSKATSSGRQGELQGVMASLTSFAGIVAPLGVAAVYGATSHTVPGLVWFVGGALSLACAPFVLSGRRRPAA